MAHEETEDWGSAFRERRGLFGDFTDELHRLIARLLADAGIETSQLQARTKTIASFTEKLERKNNKYRNPITEMTDLSGVRVVVHNIDDCPAVVALLQREFVVDPDNSQPWHQPEELDRFGYHRDHYIVSLTDRRCEAATEWRRFSGLKAEVQVRSLVVHTWAEVDRMVRYKHRNVPPEIERRVFGLSARLEAVDREIAELFLAANAARSEAAAAINEGDRAVTLDAYTVTSYAATSSSVAGWVTRALELGFSEPTQPSSDDDRVAALLNTLSANGVTSAGGLDDIMTSSGEPEVAGLQSILDTVQGLCAPGDYFAKVWAHAIDVIHLVVLCRLGPLELVEHLDASAELKAGIARTISERYDPPNPDSTLDGRK